VTTFNLGNVVLVYCSKREKPCIEKRKKKKAWLGTHPHDGTRQIKEREHMSLKNITIRTPLIH
jgi:hypothetical protein